MDTPHPIDQREDVDEADATDEPDESNEPVSEPLATNSGFATAIGGAMFGLEMALRDAPPPQVQAAEHMPEHGLAGRDDGLIIEFPEPDEPDEPDEDESP